MRKESIKRLVTKILNGVPTRSLEQFNQYVVNELEPAVSKDGRCLPGSTKDLLQETCLIFLNRRKTYPTHIIELWNVENTLYEGIGEIDKISVNGKISFKEFGHMREIRDRNLKQGFNPHTLEKFTQSGFILDKRQEFEEFQIHTAKLIYHTYIPLTFGEIGEFEKYRRAKELFLKKCHKKGIDFMEEGGYIRSNERYFEANLRNALYFAYNKKKPNSRIQTITGRVSSNRPNSMEIPRDIKGVEPSDKMHIITLRVAGSPCSEIDMQVTDKQFNIITEGEKA